MSTTLLLLLLLLQCETEAVAMEMDMITSDIDRTLDNLEEWMAPRHQPRDLVHIGNKVSSVENTDTIGTK